MSAAKRRRKAIERRNAWKPCCENCGGDGAHYVPPSLGESGFFACSAVNVQRESGAVRDE